MVDGEQASADGAGAAAGAPVSAGALLRAARERQGVHLAVLAASLKVAPRKLELMEGDRYDELPDASFARALALSMCRALKIDAEPVLAGLPRMKGERLEQMTRGLNQPFRERAGGGEGGERWRGLSLPLAGAALLVVAALVVYLLPAGLWTPSEVSPELVPGPGAGTVLPPGGADPAPAGEPANDAGAATPPTAAASAEAPGAPASSAVLDTVFLAPPEDAASVAADAASVAAPAANAPAEGLLSLSASAPSWIEVRDGRGQLLLSRTLAAGESAAVDGTPPLRLTIGNAAATQVNFRGEPVALKAGRENVVRLELK